MGSKWFTDGIVRSVNANRKIICKLFLQGGIIPSGLYWLVPENIDLSVYFVQATKLCKKDVSLLSMQVMTQSEKCVNGRIERFMFTGESAFLKRADKRELMVFVLLAFQRVKTGYCRQNSELFVMSI